MKKFALDLTLIQGKTYETGKREGLVIHKEGTDASDPASPAHLRIDNKELGDIFQDIAPLHKTNTRFVDLLDLGDLYYVVPPETEVIVEGPSGAKIRIKGDLLKLDVGEKMPPDLIGFCNLRSTWARQGLFIPPTVVDPGFEGQLVIEIVNLSGTGIMLWERERFLHLILADCSGALPYTGQYQGQRGR